MRQLGYPGVFWTLLSIRWELFCLAFLVVFPYLWINLSLATRNLATFREGSRAGESASAATIGIQISPAELKLAMGALAAAVALIFAVVFYAQWDTYLRFRYGATFGLSDPLFGVDAGFYLFRLPFYELLQGSLTALTMVTLLAVLVFYTHFGLLRFGRIGRVEGQGQRSLHTSPSCSS